MIVMQKPAGAGSQFHDYKGNESIIALVMAGPEYECLYVDVGTNGRNPDCHAWGRCSLKQALHNAENPLNLNLNVKYCTLQTSQQKGLIMKSHLQILIKQDVFKHY
jgi:hypothetical protein